MDHEAFRKHKPYAGPLKPSMLRRRVGHDYASRCIYLVTITTEGRRPLLGTLAGDADAPAGSADAPHIMLTPLGERVRQAWMDNEKHYPSVSILATMVMPDHLHGILFIREEAQVSLGTIIKGFKAGCNRAYRELAAAPQGGGTEGQKGLGEAKKRDRGHGLLWAPQYHDHILEGQGELERWRNYLRNNPRRLAIRRAHKEYFRVQFNITVAGRSYTAIGNRFLLDYPLKEMVQCSRSLTKEQIEAEVNSRLSRAKKGVIMVSPAISEGEKAVMGAVLRAGLPLIFLSPRGFNEYSRPGNRYYEACAEGRFLILAPWPHNNREVPLTRQMCLELNAMTREICE